MSTCLESFFDCFHQGVAVDVFDTIECAGTTVGRQTVNPCYLLYRLLASCYATLILFWAIEEYIEKDWNFAFLYYITHWGLIFNCLYLWSVTILHFRVYKSIHAATAGDMQDLGKYPSITQLNMRLFWRVTLFLLNSSVCWSLVIIVLFYGFIWDGNSLSLLSFHTHGVSGGLVVLDWLTSCWQLTYRAAFMTFLQGVFWTLFSVIFWLLGCENQYGESYIYEVINWEADAVSAAMYSMSCNVSIVLAHFILVFVKNLIIKKWLKSRDSSEAAMVVIATDYGARAKRIDEVSPAV